MRAAGLLRSSDGHCGGARRYRRREAMQWAVGLPVCPLVLSAACVLMQSRSGRTADRRGASGRSATRARVHHNLADCLRCMVGRLWYFLIWFRCTAFGGGDHRSLPLRLPSAFGGCWWTSVARWFACDRSSPAYVTLATASASLWRNRTTLSLWQIDGAIAHRCDTARDTARVNGNVLRSPMEGNQCYQRTSIHHEEGICRSLLSAGPRAGGPIGQC
jgi:hypothetical protein